MASLLELKQRIRALESMQTVARTLATVSAAKLARVRRRAAGLREEAASLREILAEQQRAAARDGAALDAGPPVLRPREPVRSVTLVVLAAERGMCGGYDLEICRIAEAFRRERLGAGQAVELVVRGRRGAAHLARRGAPIVHAEPWPREGLARGDADRLLALLLARRAGGAADEVHVACTELRSAIERRPRVVRLLPVELPPPSGAEPPPSERWCYEPSRAAILDELVAAYLRVQLCGALLDSYASEQGARMLTMQEAGERADRALQECRVRLHRLRREAITTDLVSALFAAASSDAGAGRPRAEGSP